MAENKQFLNENDMNDMNIWNDCKYWINKWCFDCI
jgi:hypothetical protein